MQLKKNTGYVETEYFKTLSGFNKIFRISSTGVS